MKFRAKNLHDRSAEDPMWPKRFDYGKEMNFLGSATPIMGSGSLRTPKRLPGRGPPATMPGPVAMDADWRRNTVLAPPEPHLEDYLIVLNDDGIVVSP
ncbi:hypothetical protein FHL15_006475 [Xylaria flabelliformis]|uniref:Uncharacterized protein n=1 Tax=Xylaria flabelliformis TaxID=2512241 RepID=A0A553HX71_9PEZI|nr:hypothetical protein FHL15_006475 [Xylaria flabelliformis]